ncbi:MAG TPA: DUF2752 domain-containing protein [Clostridia bacterium]|nr:DUF2752 domain-containing protein [Clostridia bacterium]
MWKNALNKLVSDLKKVWIPITACILYVVIMTILVGEVCPSKLIFGIPCAGCGMVRAFILFITFQFREAFAMNPGIFIVAAAFLIFVILRYFTHVDIKWIKILLIITLLSLIIIFVIRLITSFGTEPLVIYDKAFIFWIMKQFS